MQTLCNTVSTRTLCSTPGVSVWTFVTYRAELRLHTVFCLDQFAGVETERGLNHMEIPSRWTLGEEAPTQQQHEKNKKKRKKTKQTTTGRALSAFQAISPDRTSQADTFEWAWAKQRAGSCLVTWQTEGKKLSLFGYFVYVCVCVCTSLKTVQCDWSRKKIQVFDNWTETNRKTGWWRLPPSLPNANAQASTRSQRSDKSQRAAAVFLSVCGEKKILCVFYMQPSLWLLTGRVRAWQLKHIVQCGQQHLTLDLSWPLVSLSNAITEQDGQRFFFSFYFFSPLSAKQTGGQTARRWSPCSNIPPLHKQAVRYPGTHLCTPLVINCQANSSF